MRTHLESPGPILVAHLLAPLDALLVELLASLDDEEWETPTIAPGWRVRDVAAHLLDTSLRKLAACRDGQHLPVAGHDPSRDLIAFVNRMNADGVRFFRSVPARYLVESIRTATAAAARYHESLDPMGPARFGVSWAGEDTSPNWFDTARELTERWHHQQQIRLALRRPGATAPEFHHPVLDCFLRALPHWYRDVAAPDETRVDITIDGDGGGTWHVFRDREAWRLITAAAGRQRALVTIPGDIAWRVFTKGIDHDDALARSRVDGDRRLGDHVFGMTAIVG